MHALQADGRMGTDQGQQTAGKGPHEREMASTLAALAAAAPSSGDHPGYLQLMPRQNLVLTCGPYSTEYTSGLRF